MNKTELLAYINTQAEASRLRVRELQAGGAADDAALEKVEGNIWDIAQTLCGLSPDDGGHAVYMAHKIKDISEPWRRRLAEAAAHDDTRAVAVEERKLAVAARLNAVLAGGQL